MLKNMCNLLDCTSLSKEIQKLNYPHVSLETASLVHVSKDVWLSLWSPQCIAKHWRSVQWVLAPGTAPLLIPSLYQCMWEIAGIGMGLCQLRVKLILSTPLDTPWDWGGQGQHSHILLPPPGCVFFICAALLCALVFLLSLAEGLCLLQ